MAAAPARSERRRPRPGSLERPVSARMYRGTWLLVALPLLGAAQWFEQQLSAYGFRTQVDRFEATIPGRGRVRLENLSTVAPGSSPDTIVVMAHRDNTGASPGANDNASGTAALIELARGYANVGGGRRATPAHRILFLSTDGGAFRGLGAGHLPPAGARRNDVVAVLNLDALGGVGRPRLELPRGTPRPPPPPPLPTA